ncbi:MAG: 30S ribosomal protein S6 [Ghiorsea sp.]|nr:30S ribosomal protein S6 [Ghiorsea sp.]
MYYETVFIVNPDVSQENTEVLTNELIEKIEQAGSRIVKREYWGVRPLAYSIQKRNRGHYALLVTDGAANVSKLIDETLRLDERILRFLTTSITELSDEPSPLLRRRSTATTEEPKAEVETKETEAKAEAKAETKTEKATEEVKAEPKAEEKAAKEESGEATA